jgi:uncharacterized protein (TIGR02284 family)
VAAAELITPIVQTITGLPLYWKRIRRESVFNVFVKIRTIKKYNIMATNEKTIDVLNDLIRINNDRIDGYHKASEEIKDAADVEIKGIFLTMAEQSRKNVSELRENVTRLGGQPAVDTTASGKIYRVWMDVKATFSGDDTTAALKSCEFGEDAALKAYKDALKEEVAWPTGLTALIEGQREGLQRSHDTIKKFRDMYVAAH